MTVVETPTRVYRGTSVEEILPRIREELGPDAIVVRSRDGIVGGIAGFFGRRCVEIEAASRPVATGSPVAVVPAASVIAAYTEPVTDLDTGEVSPVAEPAGHVLEAGFGEALARAAALLEPAAVKPPRPARPATPPVSRRPLGERLEVADCLVEAGFSARRVEAILWQAATEVRPFAPVSLADAVRQALAASLRVESGARERRRPLVLAGLDAAGVSEVAGSLAAGYGRAGLSVGMVALGGVRVAAALAEATQDVRARLAVAEEPFEVPRALERIGRPEVILGIAPVIDVDSLAAARLGSLVDALGKVRTHLVLPAGVDGRDAAALHDALAASVAVHGVLPIDVDVAPRIGGIVELALEHRLVVSWIAEHGRVRPAEAAALIDRIVP